MSAVRTFIAVDLPAEVRASLSRCQERLGAATMPYVKWMDLQGIHLTLKFLGNVDQATLPQLWEALAMPVAGVSPFRLQVGALGAFPGPQNPRVLWVGLAGDLEALLTLHRSVEEAVAPLGFPQEQRPFAPHLTLGRVRETATREERQQIDRALAQVQMDGQGTMTVEQVHIMKSELARWGARYTSLYILPLGKVHKY